MLTTVIGFSTGVVIGLLLSPKSGKENRKWISEQTGEAKLWVEDKSDKIVKESERKLHKISKGVKQAIPDLYEATSSILFEEEDIEESA
tara:strand:+ start:2665 stop:2931 length:267 start_codon:yes stop_codon:yes gene_type:complete